MGRIVVGVDGSDRSRRALLWADQQATLQGALLEVIYIYKHHLAGLAYGADENARSASTAVAMREKIESAAHEAAMHSQALVDKMVEELDQTTVTGMAIESSHVADTLIEHSKGADLLVVGSRGHGGFQNLMLGSVSQQCAQHAECPVVIVPAK
ncbi:MAG: universal stress protein [Nitriliruptoraceae bacterium]